MTAKRKALIGVILGGALTVLGPALGILFTVVSVRRAFSETTGVAPSDKANHLAQGISESMNGSVFGIAAGVSGVILLVVSTVLLILAENKGPASD